MLWGWGEAHTEVVSTTTNAATEKQGQEPTRSFSPGGKTGGRRGQHSPSHLWGHGVSPGERTGGGQLSSPQNGTPLKVLLARDDSAFLLGDDAVPVPTTAHG